ncbi:MAG: hypothetical protein SFY81_07500 [Verrucomicrobiota bacterium]|nr:hypothetical protein [Verrucomicrobiota bacterium]
MISTHQFTLDGSIQLEDRLRHVCEVAGDGVKQIVPAHVFQALVLGGGYGRGEGGVLRTEAGDEPYNDLEFFLFLRGNPRLNERRFGKRLHHLAASLKEQIGIEVEFKIVNINQLVQGRVTMFYYDLVAAHWVVSGNPDLLLAASNQLSAHRITSEEAIRLLFNRCSGLLFARERLLKEQFTEEDADFVERNIAKAELAFGDVLLTARGQYHWSCRERHRNLNKIEPTDELSFLFKVRDAHQRGVEFKLHPFRSKATRDNLLAKYFATSDLAKEIWVWLESRRLGHSFASMMEYSRSPGKKLAGASWKNLLLNVRTFGISAMFQGESLRYPRERLLNALPLLLWEEFTPPVIEIIQKQLRSTVRSFSGLVSSYQSLWSTYN